jgi:hypothetical protein
MQLAPNLRQIGSDIVERYLVEGSGEITIVDAGLPGQWRELLDELGRMGRSIDDIRAPLLRATEAHAPRSRLVIAGLAWRGTDRTFAHYPSAAAHVIVER